ncbi:MAG: DUF624 domain-containing protein [Clostridia bacterium]|nr:DUF624 domain-containing protein [Clostridia bacterium]
MGLFQSYKKEGKGVEKNRVRPIRPLYFLEILGRKFWRLVQLNLVYVGLTLPIWILLAMFLFSDTMSNNFSLTYVGDFLYMLGIVFLVFSPLIGPATAGMTYVLQGFATETPVFQYADFFEQFKKNFKQATLMSAITGLFILSFSLTLIHGNSSLVVSVGFQLSTMQLPLLICLILLIFVNYYAYSIMVLFQQKFIDIIKNSFIFALAKLPLNLFVLILISVIAYFSFRYLVVGMLATILLLYALCGFLVVFSIYPTLEKYMLIPARKQQTENQIEEI